MARRWFELHIYVTKIPDDAGTKDIFAEDNISFWGRSCVHANNERVLFPGRWMVVFCCPPRCRRSMHSSPDALPTL